MVRTVAGLFGSRREADLLVEHLVQEYGLRRDRIRVFAHSADDAAEARSPQDSDQDASLRDLGLPEEETRAYTDGMRRGGIVVATQVELDDKRVGRMLRTYREYGAANLGTPQTEDWAHDPNDG
ncbi:MAG: hypothetical protein IRZ13_04050 [Acetobacteraceae bacterium]|nr:hypothetical protein [Acetobacteraceae bacterium]